MTTSINSVTAQQVTSDGTVSTTVTTPDGKNFNINDGTTRQGNLFHSFKEFSVPTGGSANFNNAADVRNIIGRVTGGSISNIDGVIRALGKANLFLLNPAGIIFGPNASLNIGGSFLGTTAHSFLFDNGFEFSATDPQAPPLLTINVPIGLRFRDNPGNITNQSNQPTIVDNNGNPIGLAVPSGNSLVLVGGDINSDNGKITVPGGRVELGGLAGVGTVGLDVNGNTFKLNFPNGSLLSNITLANDARVAVRGNGGGDIVVNANTFSATNGGRLVAGTEGVENAGDITVNANNFNISGVGLSQRSAGVANQTIAGASGNAGNIFINSKSYNALSGAAVTNDVLATSQGNGGNINITTGSFSLSDGAQLLASTYGRGNAGNVSVRASDAVELAGSNSYILTTVEAGGVGNGGNININAASLSLKDGAQLITLVREKSSTQPAGRGNAGNVTVNVTGPVTIAGVGGGFSSGIFSYVDTGTTGNGGNITISSGSLSLRNGAQLTANTYGEGNAGNLFIKVDELVEVVDTRGKIEGDTFVTTDVGPGGTGKGGDLTINTKRLVVQNSRVSASTFGKGIAGNLTVKASDSVELSGDIPIIPDSSTGAPGGLFAQADLGSQEPARGGTLTVETKHLSISNGSKVQTATFGRGDAGNVIIRASDIDIFNTPDANNFFTTGIFSGIQLDPRNTEVNRGAGGSVTIATETLKVRNGGKIDTSSYGIGNAGKLTIRASDSIEIIGVDKYTDQSLIGAPVTNVGVGNAGDVYLETRRLLVQDGGRISVRTLGEGQGGNLAIKANQIDVSGIGIAQNQNYPAEIAAGVGGNSIGKGGNLTIDVGKLNVRNGGIVSVGTEGSGDAGNLGITADSIRLDNKGAISANTTGGQGNILINSKDLVLRRNSNITTNATGENVIGGNININTGVLVGFDNSDITANSANSRGGNIKINSRGIFGFQSRNPTSPNTSDITATGVNSQSSGNVQINVVDIDPTQGLFELTETVVDPAQQVAQNPCIKGFGSTFTITGRGGLPTDPNKILSSDNVRVDLIKPVASTVSSTSTTQKQPSQKPPVKEIIPAQGWIYNEKGEVVLVAYDPTKTGPQRSQPAPTSNCAAVR
ncbi:MAG: filamentous hemagglutinin N-terminal domain-containing protein [Brasilonema angustatum HA4187-MV1]|nr:filamentous hemagglutinin N-terminal domain-containing protein [Brasilonema angustatum HA4187-MV1]